MASIMSIIINGQRCCLQNNCGYSGKWPFSNGCASSTHKLILIRAVGNQYLLILLANSRGQLWVVVIEPLQHLDLILVRLLLRPSQELFSRSGGTALLYRVIMRHLGGRTRLGWVAWPSTLSSSSLPPLNRHHHVRYPVEEL